MASKTKLKSKSNVKTLKRKLGPHREAIAWVLVVILLLLLLLAWHKPISNFFGDLTGKKSTSKGVKTTAQFLPVAGDAATSTTGTGTGGGTSATTNRSTTSNTTTNRTTTSPTTPTTGGPDPGPTPTTPTAPTTPSSNPSSLLFANILPGQSLNTVVDIAGTQPNGGCTTTQIPILGTQQLCTFSENGRNVVVTLLNNQVIAKAKAGF